MSEFWGFDPWLNSMPQGDQFAQQGEAIGPQPSQDYSEYPPKAQPQDYSHSQHFIANEHQQHGSHMHHQGPYPVPSATYGVAQPHYTGSGVFQAPIENQNMAPYSHLDPALLENIQQATFEQSTIPQAILPQEALLQATLPQEALLQATLPQEALLQATLPQATLPQATLQQATIPQATLPQATLKQSTTPQATILQEVSPQPLVTFEEQLSYFRKVPEPHPEPARRPGPGRKKKEQRFWAPEGANDDVKRHYRILQKCDERVSIAVKKLEENNGSKDPEHFQRLVLRNMQDRQAAWIKCERISLGLVAVQLDLEAAKRLVQKCHQKWEIERQSVAIRTTSLRMNYPSAVDDNGVVDNKQLNKKDQHGLQTTQNWCEKRWQEFIDSVRTLEDAINRTYGPDPVDATATGMIILEIGCYEGWSRLKFPGDSPEEVASRHFYEQFLAEHPQNLQLGNGQSAELPHANLGHGAGLDQAVGVNAQPAQDQPQPQIQQDHVSEEDPKGLADFIEEQTMAVIENFNRQEPIVFDESPQQLRDVAGEEELAPIVASQQQGQQGSDDIKDSESEGWTKFNYAKTGFRIPVDYFTMPVVEEFAPEEFEAWEGATRK